MRMAPLIAIPGAQASRRNAPRVLDVQIPTTSEAGGGQGNGDEFDFEDVFEPATPLPPVHEEEVAGEWGEPELHYGGETLVICSRSHSLVGPSSMTVSKVCTVDDKSSDGEEEEDGVFPLAEAVESKDKMGLNDFELLRVVGQGAFGKVFQVRLRDSQKIFAMKVMRKDKVLEKNHADYMIAERDILTKVVHPFIVQLRCSFQTKTKLYLILDFINGGHLFFQLYRQGIFSEDLTRFYAAEIVSAVAHLHSKGIVHRDLKPENILLDAEGHVKLTDFGLAKQIEESERATSMCGTVEYMAPEIIQAKGHGKSADWWSLGILMFEMLKGQPPFTSRNRQRLQQGIVKGKIKLPEYLSSEAHSLLKGLLQKDPAKRLGSGDKGSENIKNHKFFRGINWSKLEAGQIQPKFKPEVNGSSCIANFDERWTKLPPQDSPASTPTGGSDVFRGYSYVSPNVWQCL